jgi:hypothetical protein
MAQFVYYSTVEEWWPIFAAILNEHSLRFAVDRPYAEQSCEYYTTIGNELKTMKPPVSRVFLLGDAFSDAPLFLRKQESGSMAGKYFIDVSRGGPALDLTMPADFGRGDILRLGPQWVSFQKLYWDDTLSVPLQAQNGLKDAFGAVKKTLQRKLLRQELNEVFWVSSGAWSLFEAGQAAILSGGQWFQRTKDGIKVWSDLKDERMNAK